MRRSLFSRALGTGFDLVNRLIPWHKLPPYGAILNLIAFRDQLRQQNLHDTSKIPSTDGAKLTRCGPRELHFRTIEGTCNDLEDPLMGSAGARFGRNVPLKHTWPEPEPAILTPNPRTISRRLLARDTFKPATTLNLLAGAWIQFMVHDWFNHGTNREDDSFELPLDPGDPWHENPMRIRRTRSDPTRDPNDTANPPTYTNVVSHWWDASAIYGCDEGTCTRVRSEVDGKLAVDEKRRLPLDPQTGLSISGFTDNWWIGLGLLHTLFTLEHNAICERLKREYPSWSDDQLFGTARLINSALMAKIHTVEWTPGILSHPALQIGMAANWWGLATERVYRMFGRISDSEILSGIPGSQADHHGVPYALTEEFVSVYRLHPLIPDDLEIRSITTGEVLKQLTFPEVAAKNAETVIDDRVSVIDVLYSFGTSHPGAITLHNYPRFLQEFTMQDNGIKIDLAAVDVMRDRERGVPRYNQFRKLHHLAPAKSFDDLTSNRQWASELRDVYEGDVNRVDLMVGMFAEDLPKGFGFSDTAFRIFILMASRRLKSDRFFTADFTPRVYTPVGMEWITENTMSTVLLRHYPELTSAMRKVSNAFAPWARLA